MSEHCFETANLYYDIKEYKKTFTICMDLLEENCNAFLENADDSVMDDNYKIGSLAAKAILFLTPTPDSKEKKLFYDAVKLAIGHARNIDEWRWIENDIMTALYEWEKEKTDLCLTVIKNKLELGLYQAYIRFRSDFLLMDMTTKIYLRSLSTIEEFCEKKGVTKEEIFEEQNNSLPEGLSDDELATLHYDTAKDIYDGVKSKLIEYADVNLDAAQSITLSLCHQYIIASNIVKLHVNKDNPELYLKSLKLKAEIEREYMEAKIYPNGNPLSVFRGDRASHLNNTLKATYEEIIELEPDFEIPPLPSIECFDFPKHQNQSGGCYVATAVYGSYDCPEVWTLRRFRDNTLAKSLFGRLFIYLYYAVSPTLVKWFGGTEWFKSMWKPILDEKVKKLNLNGVENTPYNDRQW